MSKSLKITGFARFLIFLILFVPTVVFGVLYAKYGEEGLSISKAVELFSGEEAVTDPSQEIARLQDQIADLEKQIAKKQRRIEELQAQ